MVEEIPTYEPSGSGEHLFLWVQKRDVAAGDLLRIVSSKLKVKDRDVGVAGQKDRRAVTRQWISVPATCEAAVKTFAHDAVQILQVARHSNKLRTGHLQGNRFQIVLRSDEACRSAMRNAVRERLRELEAEGFPNYFGEQRFGHDGSSLQRGLDLLSKSKTQQKKIRISAFQRRMFASAVQSAVFNRVVAWRVQQGTVDVPLDGDVVCRRGGIRPFLYSRRNADESAQLVPMGPMPGGKMLAAEGQIANFEQSVLSELGLEPVTFDSKLTPGTRRPMLAWLTDCRAECVPAGLRLEFELKAGCYATVLLKELVGQLVPGE